eukprot:3976007-Prymnesium_polylepis.1
MVHCAQFGFDAAHKLQGKRYRARANTLMQRPPKDSMSARATSPSWPFAAPAAARSSSPTWTSPPPPS